MREMMPTSGDENQPNMPTIPTGAIVSVLCKEWKNAAKVSSKQAHIVEAKFMSNRSGSWTKVWYFLINYIIN